MAGFFIWLIVLIRGRVPQPVFDGTASVVRYQSRFYAYLTLLTARYPVAGEGLQGGYQLGGVASGLLSLIVRLNG